MSIIRIAVTAATIARTVVLHPAFQAGLALAPVLLTPEVKTKARDAVLAGAHGAGVVARRIVDSAQRR
ncbi:hypothetical protein [Devosia sp.]|uniref:hypothetical protein n=1 Tax=Devosia sp. TaxID=1871048 RepID=UPI003BAD0AC3